jgi:hypothetical protein
MHTKYFTPTVILFAVLLSACSAPTAVAPYSRPTQVAAVPTARTYPTPALVPTFEPAPTSAPAEAMYPTPAPTSGPLPIGAAPALTATPAYWLTAMPPATPPADNTFRDYGVNP